MGHNLVLCPRGKLDNCARSYHILTRRYESLGCQVARYLGFIEMLKLIE